MHFFQIKTNKIHIKYFPPQNQMSSAHTSDGRMCFGGESVCGGAAGGGGGAAGWGGGGGGEGGAGGAWGEDGGGGEGDWELGEIHLKPQRWLGGWLWSLDLASPLIWLARTNTRDKAPWKEPTRPTHGVLVVLATVWCPYHFPHSPRRSSLGLGSPRSWNRPTER